MISLHQLVQICKERCTGKSSVSRYDCMGAFSSCRKRASLQMSRRFFQNLFLYGMINGDPDIDFRDRHIAHHPVAVQVQAVHIIRIRLVRSLCDGKGIRKNARKKFLVISICSVPLGLIINLSCFLFLRHL